MLGRPFSVQQYTLKSRSVLGASATWVKNGLGACNLQDAIRGTFLAAAAQALRPFRGHRGRGGMIAGKAGRVGVRGTLGVVPD